MVFAQVSDFSNFFDFFTIMFIVVAIIILIVFIVIIYFIIRVFSGGSNKRSERMSPAKPYPKNVFKKEETSKLCTYCGAKITEELVICPECGEQLN